MKQCDLTKGFVVFLTITITFFFGLMPSAWAKDVYDCDDCKGQKFKGCYGLAHAGKMVLPGPDGPVEASIASTGILNFDKRIITGHETVTMSLEIPIEPFFVAVPPFDAKICGTYVVYDDCSGKAWICVETLDGLPPAPGISPQMAQEIAFVITNGGKHIQIMTTKMNTSCCIPELGTAPGEDPCVDPCEDDCAKNLDNYPMGDVSPISLAGSMEPCGDDQPVKSMTLSIEADLEKLPGEKNCATVNLLAASDPSCKIIQPRMTRMDTNKIEF